MEKNDQIFLQLIYMFHTSAMQGLGKVADPTGQIHRNLEYVSQTIDLMEMLLVKTKGNISEDIEKMITQMISELKLNYVDEKSKLESIDIVNLFVNLEKNLKEKNDLVLTFDEILQNANKLKTIGSLETFINKKKNEKK